MSADWLTPDWDLPAEWPGIRALMTTRHGGVSVGRQTSMNLGGSVNDEPAAVAANRARLSEVLGAPVVFVHQVHGTDVLHVQGPHVPGPTPKADASFSVTPGVGCAIQAADCLPVLFAAKGGVGGAHAGWRGLAAGVVENTLRALCSATGSEPGELRVWLGACIGPTAFEVGADVLQALGAEPLPFDQACFTYQPNAAGEPRWRADLAGLARARLQAAGVRHISGGHWCTYSEPERFFSYRRERDGYGIGRMAAAISLV